MPMETGDALKFDFASLGNNLRVVGNLPYNISTPLLFHLAEHIASVRDIHAMLQKEVVERMVAAPDTSAYGRLSVALQYRFDMEKVLDVGPDAFYPQPKVESAVIRMTPRLKCEPEARDEALFARIVTTAFSQRRKTLRNTLRNMLQLADFEALGIDPSARAETLSVSDFVRIANRLS
jgi:16S rRNA (adenine1518-N6/adenine1519-N6)-dimethyltransferase